MELLISNQTDTELDEEFLNSWVSALEQSLQKRDVFFPEVSTELVLAFVSVEEMQQMNLEFRGKDRPTDVLSFEGIEECSLGELIFCLDVIQENSVAHDLSFKEELAYMLVHGVLHLLGYDHEEDEEEAKVMFELQDSVFEELCQKGLAKS